MPLAAIVGICLLLPWPPAAIVASVSEPTVWQSAESQENQTSSSAPHDSSAPTPADQQKAPDQSTPTAAIPTSPCPDNSQAGTTAKPNCKPAESPAGKAKKHHRIHKTASPEATPAETGPPKKVVRNGGTEDPVVDLSPRPNPQQASKQSENTKQLLAASDANLNKISGRSLTANQKETVKQINSYMEQAKKALNDGDVQRAYNLALKANLLSAELAGH